MVAPVAVLLTSCGAEPPADSAAARVKLQVRSGSAIVLEWNDTGAAVISQGRPPFIGYYYLAMMDVAMYDASNATGGSGGRYAPFAVDLGEVEDASREAAVISAAYNTLLGLPLTDPQRATVTTKYDESLSTVDDSDRKTNGIAVGERVAAGVLAAFPPTIPPSTYTVLPPGPGVWEPTPPMFSIAAPGFARMTPFLMSSPSQFRLGPPPALTSDSYTADYNELKDYGGVVSLRSPEQTDTANLYAGESGVTMYSRALKRIVQEHDLDFVNTVRLAAMWWTVAADSQVLSWDTKYHYSFWRPITAINRGDIDGNDATVADTTWLPSTPTPGHPEYPSAHSAFTGGITEVLRGFFGTDNVHVVLESNIPLFPGARPVHKSFERLAQVDADVIDGRVFAGIHFRNSNAVAVAAGHAMVHSQLAAHFHR
jgi:hypothetical protein